MIENDRSHRISEPLPRCCVCREKTSSPDDVLPLILKPDGETLPDEVVGDRNPPVGESLDCISPRRDSADPSPSTRGSRKASPELCIRVNSEAAILAP